MRHACQCLEHADVDDQIYQQINKKMIFFVAYLTLKKTVLNRQFCAAVSFQNWRFYHYPKKLSKILNYKLY